MGDSEKNKKIINARKYVTGRNDDCRVDLLLSAAFHNNGSADIWLDSSTREVMGSHSGPSSEVKSWVDRMNESRQGDVDFVPFTWDQLKEAGNINPVALAKNGVVNNYLHPEVLVFF